MKWETRATHTERILGVSGGGYLAIQPKAPDDSGDWELVGTLSTSGAGYPSGAVFYWKRPITEVAR